MADVSNAAAELKQKLDLIWEDDAFGQRQEDADNIEGFLHHRAKAIGTKVYVQSCVLNLDAGWGQGKTFFMKKFANHLRQKGYLVAEVNAWRDDHSDDPFVPVVSQIDQVMKPLLEELNKDKRIGDAIQRAYGGVVSNFGSLVGAGFRGLGKGVAKKLMAEAAEEFAEDVASALSNKSGKEIAKAAVEGAGDGLENEISAQIDKLTTTQADKNIKDFAKAQVSIFGFRSNLETVLKLAGDNGLRLPLVVLIDELDRCRPTYAVAMLERIKHLFEVPNVAFVLATDTDQLCHSIKNVYGAGFDAQIYLRRFFDRAYKFSDPTAMQTVAKWMNENADIGDKLIGITDHGPDVTIAAWLSTTKLSIRSREQCLEHLGDIARGWTEKHGLEVVILMPLIMAHHLGLEADYSPGALKAFDREVPENPQLGAGSRAVNLPSLLHRIGGALVGCEGWPAEPENIDARDWSAREFVYTMRREERDRVDQHGPGLRRYPEVVRRAGKLRAPD